LKLLIQVAFLINFSFAQNANTLIERKNNLLQEIELSKNTLQSAKKQKHISIEELQALSTYIELRTDLKETIIQQKDSIELYKKEIEYKIKNTQEKKEIILQSYKNLVQMIYFNDFGINFIDFVFSTSSFQEAINRYIYYKNQESLRQKLLKELDFLQKQLVEFSDNLNQNIALKDTLINEFNVERDSLAFLKMEKERIKTQLTNKEKELTNYINNKQKETKKIETEIIEIQRKLAFEKNNLNEGLGFEKSKSKLIWPVEKGIILSAFGEVYHKDLPGIKVVNNGIEIGTEKESMVRSVYNGVVSKIITTPKGLEAVMIRHGEYLTVYSNLKETHVQVGQKVFAGNKIGVVFSRQLDNTGILEFQIWKGVKKINPMNWLKNN